MAKERWYGYIKDYDGGTLMECYIHPAINFLNVRSRADGESGPSSDIIPPISLLQVPEMVRQQRAFVLARLRERSQAHVRRVGLREGEWDFSADPHTGQRTSDTFERVSGLREAGWTHEDLARSLQHESQRDQHNLQHELQQVRRPRAAPRARRAP